MPEEKSECTCKIKDCPRHGKCGECIEHHRLNKRHPPYCRRAGRRGKAKTPGEPKPGKSDKTH